MRASNTVAGSDRYVLTQQGHEDLVYAQRCQCTPRIVGLLVECPQCGTVYGHVRDIGDGQYSPHKKV